MTEPRYLLDSDICIFLMQGEAPLARQRVEACRPGEIITSAVTYAEVIRGARRRSPERRAEATLLFGVIPILPFDKAAADLYAVIPFKRGTFDRLISAHALALGVTVITNNERDYADVPGLKVENWMKE